MTCKNPECNKDIISKKSAKRRYCSDSCKNRANYLRRQQTYGHIFEWDKLMRHNYHILLKLKQKDLGPVSCQTLESHGVEFGHLHKDEAIIDDNGVKMMVSRVYDILFTINNKQELIFI